MQEEELGRFLRAHRARRSPQDAGLPHGAGRRRTPGLRREEVATLAGVSVDYYTRLEQGRDRRPGPAVLAALAAVLGLTEEESAFLRSLAARASTGLRDRPADGAGRGRSGRGVRPEIRQLLEVVRPCPAYVLTRSNDLLCGNAGGLRLLPGLRDWPTPLRNTTRYTFLHPAAQGLYRNWAEVAADAVAHLRSVGAEEDGAADVAALVAELEVKSPRFAALWNRYDVGRRSHGRKSFRHPDVGDLTMSYEVLTIGRTPGDRLVVYQAAEGTSDRDAMVLLDREDQLTS